MKTKIAKIFSLTIFLVTGCFSTSRSADNPTATTAIIALNPTVIQSYAPTVFSIPTLSTSQQTELIQVLKSDSCNLPCYLGIEPGKTTFKQAEIIIVEIGGTLRADYENFYEGYPEKQPLHLTSYILNFLDVDKTIYQNIDISEKNGKVQQIAVDIFGNFQPMFYEGWKKYSMKAVFQNYGIPDQITIETNTRSYAVRAAYLEYGTIIEWSGIHQEDSSDYKVCPKFSSQNTTSLLVAVTDTKSPFEIVPSSYMGFEEMYKSTEEILGISKKKFYDQVVIDDSVCFDILVK